ncbi:MAG: hypothetical protein WCI36_00975 [bacterium]
MKKVFIISSVLLFVVLIFLGIYNFAFKKESKVVDQSLNNKDVQTTVESKVKEIKIEKITSVTKEAVIGTVIDKKTQDLKYYNAASGIVWMTDGDGKQERQLSQTRVANLTSVFWSPDQNKVLTVTKKEGKEAFYMYDYVIQKGTLLNAGLDTVVWDNIGTKIFYKYFDKASSKRSLNIANPDGSEWQKLADIEARILKIAAIPLTSEVSYWNYPNANEETILQSISVTGGQPKKILTGRYGADYVWSPDGANVLVSSLSNKNDKTVMLGIVTFEGKYQDLNVPTIASKCVWSRDGKTIFYALPGGIPAGSLMPNDYQENKFNTDDTFWKMDITTGKKERIIETNEIIGKYDSINLFLSATQDALYFTNKIDNKLYKISL